jgi:large subunit ribosomal protein L6
MSRIGKIPVVIPDGVKALLLDGAVVIEGPKGKLSFKPNRGIKVVCEPKQIVVSLDSNATEASKVDWGTTRATILNMVNGVTKLWKRSLEMNGVGFNAKLQGQKIILSVGFSHEVEIEIPKEVKCAVTKTTIDLESVDKQLVGTLAAKIRKVQPPEPYLGKGIKFSEETVRRKAGKTGKK